MFTKLFLQAMLERALKTFAQTLLALFTGNQTNVLNVNWGQSLAVAASAALFSVLSSVISAQTNPTGSPSLVEAPSTTGNA